METRPCIVSSVVKKRSYPTRTSFSISPLGDAAVVIRFGETIGRDVLCRVRAFSDYLDERPQPDVIEHVPAYTTVTLFYNPLRRSYRDIEQMLQGIISNLGEKAESEPRIVEIPVCYGGDFGPDLEFVAQHNSLRVDEVIEIHAATDYLVYMIGFAPGFPYLGGMSEQIAAPRRTSPRLRVPAGSVGIAGAQTGVYPLETPGGWQLIGQTPLSLFLPNVNPPTLLQAGDHVQFRPITRAQYEKHVSGREPPACVSA